MNNIQPKIVMIEVAKLIPYAMNSRTHSPEQVAQIAASIKEFGFTNPVLTDGDNSIIAGHGRVMAAQKLDIALVPCIELKHLTEAQRKAYIIADNKLSLNAGWDFEVLRAEIQELQAFDFDLELTGFNAAEIEQMMMPIIDEPPKIPLVNDEKRNTLVISDDDESRIESLFEELRSRGYQVKVME